MKEPEPREEWVNVEEAAHLLGTTVNAVYLRHSRAPSRRGRPRLVRAARLDGRLWWRREDIQEAATVYMRARI